MLPWLVACTHDFLSLVVFSSHCGTNSQFGTDQISAYTRLSPCSKWADLSYGEDEKMVALIVSKLRCALDII